MEIEVKFIISWCFLTLFKG